jgi:hypothetical protein
MSLPRPTNKTQSVRDRKEDDDRQFRRLPFRGRARAVVYPPPQEPAAEPQEWEVLTTDLSRGGLSIMHRKQLQRGQQLLLVLSDTSRQVEVCWCCRVWAGLYASGCRFTDAADFGQVRSEPTASERP